MTFQRRENCQPDLELVADADVHLHAFNSTLEWVWNVAWWQIRAGVV